MFKFMRSVNFTLNDDLRRTTYQKQGCYEYRFRIENTDSEH